LLEIIVVIAIDILFNCGSSNASNNGKDTL